METKFRTWLALALLSSSLVACNDHGLGGTLSPVRLWLASIKTLGLSSYSTYKYDDQNRPVTISQPKSETEFDYSDPAQSVAYIKFYILSNRTSGSALSFPYNYSGQDFTTKSYSIYDAKINTSVINGTTSYHFDANHHLNTVTHQGGGINLPSYSITRYTYVGDNITEDSFFNQQTLQYRSVYEFDTMINPYYNSMLLLGSNEPFNRNNVTKMTTYDASGAVSYTIVNQYEYNAQGLPIKRTASSGNSSSSATAVSTYTYESY